MSTYRRLSEVFQDAPEVTFDNSARFILFSDCHRGDNSWADDSSHNQMLMFHALRYYHEAGFTYIEVGDGDELWENADFSEIRRSHSHLYWLMQQFYRERRFFLLFGNHNILWKYPRHVEKHLHRYYDEVDQAWHPLFPGITPLEGLVLHHEESDTRLFVVHGHQGDLLSDTLWPLSQLLVRALWKPLQLLGVRDPTSPAQNFTKRNKVEKKIVAWIRERDQPVICGHTHRSVFPDKDEAPYYNTGSGVHPRCITGLEIVEGKIQLIKWWVEPDIEGVLRVTRTLLEGPRALSEI
ncbi:MAG: serine/threonine protein phosphatase [Anaerolineae bacterium]